MGQEHFSLIIAMRLLAGRNSPLAFGSSIPHIVLQPVLMLRYCAMRTAADEGSPRTPPPPPHEGEFATIQCPAHGFNLLQLFRIMWWVQKLLQVLERFCSFWAVFSELCSSATHMQHYCFALLKGVWQSGSHTFKLSPENGTENMGSSCAESREYVILRSVSVIDTQLIKK